MANKKQSASTFIGVIIGSLITLMIAFLFKDPIDLIFAVVLFLFILILIMIWGFGSIIISSVISVLIGFAVGFLLKFSIASSVILIIILIVVFSFTKALFFKR